MQGTMIWVLKKSHFQKVFSRDCIFSLCVREDFKNKNHQWSICGLTFCLLMLETVTVSVVRELISIIVTITVHLSVHLCTLHLLHSHALYLQLLQLYHQLSLATINTSTLSPWESILGIAKPIDTNPWPYNGKLNHLYANGWF